MWQQRTAYKEPEYFNVLGPPQRAELWGTVLAQSGLGYAIVPNRPAPSGIEEHHGQHKPTRGLVEGNCMSTCSEWRWVALTRKLCWHKGTPQSLSLKLSVFAVYFTACCGAVDA